MTTLQNSGEQLTIQSSQALYYNTCFPYINLSVEARTLASNVDYMNRAINTTAVKPTSQFKELQQDWKVYTDQPMATE